MVLTMSHVTQEVYVFSLTLMGTVLNISQEEQSLQSSRNILFPVAG